MTIPKICLIIAMMAGFSCLARAQEPEPVPVPLDAKERSAIMEACAAAQWASKRQFEGLCDYLRNKFDAAVKAAADAKPAKPKE